MAEFRGFYTNPSVGLQTFEQSAQGSLRFPKHLGDMGIPYVLFSPYKRDRILSSTQPEAQASLLTTLPIPSWTIALPVPSSALASSYTVKYDAPQIGTGAGALVSGIQGYFQGATSENKFNRTIEALGVNTSSVDNFAKGFGELARAAASQGESVSGILAYKGIAAAAGEPLTDLLFGSKLNPFTEVLFNSVPFRVFDFKYGFYPRNQAESEMIDQIIQRFKFYMLPAYSGSFSDSADFSTWLNFPYEWQIHYSINNTTFTVLPSVLTDLQVSFASDMDTPKFFPPTEDGRRYPTSINLTLTFQETFILTRNYINAGVDVNALPRPVDPTNENRQFSEGQTKEYLFGTTYRF